jgi:hypothetical protein
VGKEKLKDAIIFSTFMTLVVFILISKSKGVDLCRLFLKKFIGINNDENFNIVGHTKRADSYSDWYK